MTLTFTVPGIPAPQGSKRHVGKGVMVESCKALRPWRDSVAWAAIAAGSRAGWEQPEGAVELHLAFYFLRPKSVKREYPHVKPDNDKLQRAVFDALTQSGIIRDDAQIVDVVSRKRYGTRAELRVELWPMEAA